MKIVIYINSLTCGGAERVSVALANFLAEQGHELVVITMHLEERDFYKVDASVRRVSLNLVGVHSGLGKLIANYRRWHALRCVLKLEKPDIVVAMMTTSIVLATLAAIGLPVRVYGSERNFPGRKATGWACSLLRRLVYRFADAHIAQTRESAVWLEQHTRAKNIHVIPNPVVWPIPSTKPHVEPEAVISSARKLILAVGTKVDQKGFDLLVQAFAGLTVERAEWDLVILGIDPNSSKTYGGGASIKVLADELGIADRVYLLGRVGNVADWYTRAEIFALSSRYEGFPNVLIEALASGCASIAFDCDTGPRDIIQDGVNGCLVQPENIDEFRSGLAKLMEDDSLREKFSKNGVMVRDTFSEEKIMGLWAKAIGLAKV